MKLTVSPTARLAALLAAVSLVTLTQAAHAQLAPSPEWRQVLPTGPIPGTRMTEEFVKEVGKLAYVWAYPMVNLQSRQDIFGKVKEAGLLNGVLPAAPINELAMLTGYIDPAQRAVAAPNQDVVYGQAVLDLSKEPVVVQVPDFEGRFFMYQAVDQRTDAFAEIGSMYGTRIGYYLLAGPDWRGEMPKGIANVFRSPTNVAFLFPRILMNDTPEDKKALMEKLQYVMAYPLSQYDRIPKKRDWSTLKTVKVGDSSSGAEMKWVNPENFPAEFARVVENVKPMAGEETLHALFRSLSDAAARNPKVKEILKQAAVDADKTLVAPMFDSRNFGVELPHNWSTITNGAEFGSDYYTRAAAAKANIFINKPNEARYFTQTSDEKGQALNGKNRYAVTFAKDTPPVAGFWSLTLYNKDRFFEPNEIKRYSIGTKNKDLKFNPDGSVTLYVQADAPTDPAQRANWLPAPKDDFQLYLRAYWPKVSITDGSWSPPAVKQLGEARAVGGKQ